MSNREEFEKWIRNTAFPQVVMSQEEWSYIVWQAATKHQEAAVEAAYVKAAEVCVAFGGTLEVNDGENYAEEIRALSGTDALRELMFQVAVIVDAGQNRSMDDLTAIVDHVLGGK